MFCGPASFAEEIAIAIFADPIDWWPTSSLALPFPARSLSMLVSLKWLSKYIDLADEPRGTRAPSEPVGAESRSHRHDQWGCRDRLGSHQQSWRLSGAHRRRSRNRCAVWASCHDPRARRLRPSGTSVDSLLAVENQFLEACPRYTARVIQGVKVGPSPDWMVEALQSVFWKRKTDGSIEQYQSINNVVDATNYVLMECGQPLHAFDYAKVAGSKIIVRPAEKGEKIEAIDHRQYELDESMCVIADAAQASAVAGVMGGAVSEVSDVDNRSGHRSSDFHAVISSPNRTQS